jgi:hypothetical protein
LYSGTDLNSLVFRSHYATTSNPPRQVSTFIELPLSALVPPAVFRLRPFEVERVPAGVIARLGVNQHAGHILGVDGKYETTVGTRLEHVPYDTLPAWGNQNKKR